jgi:hypothetical protein
MTNASSRNLKGGDKEENDGLIGKLPRMHRGKNGIQTITFTKRRKPF